MPSTSQAQHNFMAAVAHGWKPRKGGLSEEQAEEFIEADRGGKFDRKTKKDLQRKAMARRRKKGAQK